MHVLCGPLSQTWEESAVQTDTQTRSACLPPPSASHTLRLEHAAHTDSLTGLRGCAGKPLVQEFRVGEEVQFLALGMHSVS